MLAKDGKEFDIDNIGKLQNDELEIIQFLRPDGKRRRMSAKLTKELVRKAKNMIISAEELTTGKVAIYGRMVGVPIEKEYLLLADNCESSNSPNNILEKVILHVAETQTTDKKSPDYNCG